MSSVEIATTVFHVLMSGSLIAIAWGVSRISSSLARIRDADQLTRETQGQSILTQIDSVADGMKELGRQQSELLRNLHPLLDPAGEWPTIAGMPSPSKEPPAGSAPAPSLTPPPHLTPALGEPCGAAEKQRRTGPDSSRTMIGVGAAQVNGQEAVPTPPSTIPTH